MAGSFLINLPPTHKVTNFAWGVCYTHKKANQMRKEVKMAIHMNEKASFVCDSTDKSLTIYVRGEIDHHSAVAIRNGIDALLFEKRPTQLRLDLSAVGFMDSSGLGLIMGRLSVMKELGGHLLIINPSRETQSILSLAGMERLVPIAYTKDTSNDSTIQDEPVKRRPQRRSSRRKA